MSTRKRNSILIVDDERANISALNSILSTEYTVYASSDGPDAIETAKAFVPDVIVLDVLMPDMDGYDVIAELKRCEATRGIPVIFITGLDGIDAEQKGLALGAADYIPKPFHPEIVKMRIQMQMNLINDRAALDERLRQQALMTKISHNFIAASDTDRETLFGETLRNIGEFMDMATILLYRLDDDGKTLVCCDEWLKPELNVNSRIGDKYELREPLLSMLVTMLVRSENAIYLHSKNSEYGNHLIPKRDFISNYIVTPIFTKGSFSAALVLSKENDAEMWSESETNLAIHVSSIFSSVFEREAIEHDLNVVLQLKADLISAREQAENLSRVKSEFLSRMSHEMLTPMNAIIGMVQVARLKPDKTHDCFCEIDVYAKQLLALIRDVLDVSSMEYSIFKLTDTLFDSRALFDEIIQVAAFNATSKNQALRADIDPTIPVNLVSDVKRLKQVITNLLANAVKFTPENGEITFGAVKADENETAVILRVEVADNGIGIESAQIPTLFDLFVQADGSMTRQHGGIGIGLALSKRIAVMMDGDITVESEPGKGARFTFTCRIQKCPDAAGADGADFSGKRVLLVEDVASNRVVVKSILETTGAQIIEAVNGKEGVETYLAQHSSIDMILMDIRMPVMNGYDATRKIRSSGMPNAEDIPILALTAHTSSEDIEAAREAGMNFHLGKPVEPQTLIYAMKSYFQ
jgi:signal transduction histidine kinase/response regulator RpfG family c-di-GMP phosphodiesterase